MKRLKDLYTRYYKSKRDKLILNAKIFLTIALILFVPALALGVYDTFFNSLSRPLSLCIWCFDRLSALLSIVAACFAIVIPDNYVKNFEEKDWKEKGNDNYVLTVPAYEHGFWNNPNVIVYERNKCGIYSLVLCDIDTDKGEIVLTASCKLQGKVIIN